MPLHTDTGRPWLVSGFFTLFFVMLAVAALDFGESARVMPLLVAAPGAALSLLQLYRDIHARGEDKRAREGAAPLAMIAWLAALVVCCLGLGLSLGAALFILLFLLFRAGYQLRYALPVAAGFAVVQYAVFTLLLDIQLYRGAIAGYIGQ